MMDFTSARYMGMAHSSHSLAPWKQLTTGRPGILHTPSGHRQVAAQLAKLVGCEKVMLGPSTLHLFWDLFNILAMERIAIYFDSAAYPIARWGAVQARLLGRPIADYPHHDPATLEEMISKSKNRNLRPVIVTDGFCTGCGKSAPIDKYVDMVRPRGGQVVVDDTQSLGIWGQHPTPVHPYGSGGGGSLRKAATGDKCIILINSLAKAFGAPLGMIGGSNAFVRRFNERSQTRVHCSAPSAAAVAAAAKALAINAKHGDKLRRRLARLVACFKKQIARLPIFVTKGLFPVQSLRWRSKHIPHLLYRRLQEVGIRTVLNRYCKDRHPQLSFLFTSVHTFADIRHVTQKLWVVDSHNRFVFETRRRHDAIRIGY